MTKPKSTDDRHRLHLAPARRAARGAAFVAACAVAVAALPARADDATKSFTLGYSTGFMDLFQKIQAKMMMKSAELNELKALPATDANGDAGKQDADVRGLIKSGAQGLIVIPIDSHAIVPTLDFAAANKTPVVSIDIGPAGGKVAMIVRADNLRMGQDACKLVGKALAGHGKVLSLMGEQTTINGHDRTVAFDSCMASSYPGIKVVEEPTHWKSDVAISAARTALTANPDIAAVYLQSDGVMLAGVMDVMKNAGKLQKVGAPGHLYTVTIDGTPGAMQALRDGMVDNVIAQPVNQYVEYGLAYLQQAIDGASFKPGPTDHDSQIVTFNGNPMDLLPAPIVTSANVNNPNFWGNRSN